jgi:hypothetical protein
MIAHHCFPDMLASHDLPGLGGQSPPALVALIIADRNPILSRRSNAATTPRRDDVGRSFTSLTRGIKLPALCPASLQCGCHGGWGCAPSVEVQRGVPHL